MPPSAKFTIDRRALQAVRQRLTSMAASVRSNAGEAVHVHASDVLAHSQDRVPVKTGALKRSGYVAVRQSGNTVAAQVGYSAPYAATVHEDPDARHPTGDYKYLEAPLRKSAGGLLQTGAAAVRRALSSK